MCLNRTIKNYLLMLPLSPNKMDHYDWYNDSMFHHTCETFSHGYNSGYLYGLHYTKFWENSYPRQNNNLNKKYSIHKFLLSVVYNLFIVVCMGLKAILCKIVSLLRIYLGAITSAFLRSLQGTDSFPTWSVVEGKWPQNALLANFP